MLKKFFLILWLLTGSLLATGYAYEYPAGARAVLTRAHEPILGHGTFRYFGVKVYTAFLHTNRSRVDENSYFDGQRLCLVLRYHRSIDKKHIIKAAMKNLQNRYGQNFSALSSRVESLHKAYESVRKGDRYALVYEGGHTSLYFNGILKTQIYGQDFAQAYFGIWLGPDSIDGRLRNQLLNTKIHS